MYQQKYSQKVRVRIVVALIVGGRPSPHIVVGHHPSLHIIVGCRPSLHITIDRHPSLLSVGLECLQLELLSFERTLRELLFEGGIHVAVL